jgi:hypothetical protein
MTVLIKKHATAPFGRAVFYAFALFLGSVLNAVFGTGTLIKDAANGLASIDLSPSKKVATGENRPAFDVGKGGDRFFVLNYMTSVANQNCTIQVMKQNQLNKPGSPCQSFGDHLIYTKLDGDRQIVLGVINGRNIETKAVIVPNEWQNGEWRVAAIPGFDWTEAARILAAGNAH